MRTRRIGASLILTGENLQRRPFLEVADAHAVFDAVEPEENVVVIDVIGNEPRGAVAHHKLRPARMVAAELPGVLLLPLIGSRDVEIDGAVNHALPSPAAMR